MKISANQPAIDFATLELLPLGVIVVDGHGTILFYNHREEEISGQQRQDVVGKNFFLDVAPCTAVKAFHGRFQSLIATGQERAEFDFTFPLSQGPRHVRINLQPFRKQDEPFCVIFVADLSERELLRERIQQSQRFSELGEVAAKVAHNFNNLLHVVKMSSELAFQAGSPEVQRQMGRVLLAVDDGSALVSRCLEIAKAGSAAMEPLDLNEALATAVDFARPFANQASQEEGREIKIRINLLPGPLWVAGQAGELREAILNLLRNAIDAIPAKGTVRVLSSRQPGTAVVDILDDGTGMSDEVQHMLFTPMFTTKGSRGTGLGLATVHSTLRRHGGTIQVQSALGKGTHVHLTLPEVDPALGADGPEPRPGQP